MPCSVSTVRDRKRNSITLNKSSARAFQRATHQGSTPPLTSSKWGFIMPRVVVFWTTSTMKDEKSAAKFHYIQTVSSNVAAQSIAFRVVSICWQGTTPSPEILAPSHVPPPEGSEFLHILPCSPSTVRDRKRSSITLNKNSARAFQRAIHQGSAPPLTSSTWGSKCLDLSSFGRLRQ